jgi:hypothetical protein
MMAKICHARAATFLRREKAGKVFAALAEHETQSRLTCEQIVCLRQPVGLIFFCKSPTVFPHGVKQHGGRKQCGH